MRMLVTKAPDPHQQEPLRGNPHMKRRSMRPSQEGTREPSTHILTVLVLEIMDSSSVLLLIPISIAANFALDFGQPAHRLRIEYRLLWQTFLPKLDHRSDQVLPLRPPLHQHPDAL